MFQYDVWHDQQKDGGPTRFNTISMGTQQDGGIEGRIPNPDLVQFRRNLPIFAKRNEILDAVADSTGMKIKKNTIN